MTEFQGSLFGPPNAYGDRQAVARSTDPASSHQAAERMTASGRAASHARIALALVQRKPGCTFHELWHEAATPDERAALGDATELMRRLGGLRHEGSVQNGPARACRVKGTLMMTWEAKL